MSQKGFTLIEMICTVALLGVLILIDIPYSHEADNAKFDTIKKQFVNDIRYCQQMSSFNNKRYYLRIEQNGSGYTITQSFRAIKSESFPGFIKLRVIKGSIDLSFDEEGIPSSSNNSGAGGTYELSSRYHKAIITIRPVTGRVYVSE